MAKNRLYYGDNLDVLRRYVPDESVDLVYLYPPFNSNANYHVLFAEKTGTKTLTVHCMAVRPITAGPFALTSALDALFTRGEFYG
jgi:hypothetical protein